MFESLIDFFLEPVDEQQQQQAATTQQQQEPRPRHEETPAAPLESGESEKLTDEESKTRKALDTAYWPYAFTPTGDNVEIGTDEVLENGYDSEGSEEAYAGQWVREMFEAHELHEDDNTWVGYTHDNVRGVQEAGIEYKSLFRHMAFFGVTGYGKSTVLKNLMFQWAAKGHGFCFIDPKGQDIKELVQTLPEDRLDDIVWVEPGNEEADYTVGFNFFDTRREKGDPGYENEVQEIVDDFVAILEASVSGWGATMETVAKATATQLVRAEENYTILDLYKILAEEDERDAFADQFGDELEQVFLRRMANYDDDEMDPLLRRLMHWTDNRSTRKMVAHRESTINISEIVEDGKILLVRLNSVPSNQLKSLVSTTIVRRIWATIRSRADTTDQSALNPFFIIMDEFDMLTPDKEGSMGVGDMLSKGRSLRLSLCLANQQPTQLPESIREDLSNVDNLFTFAPGQNPSVAKDLGDRFGVDIMEIMGLSQFELLGRLKVGNQKTDAILVQSFAPYPPRRTPEVADAIVQRSIERYGTPTSEENKDVNFDQYGLLGREEENEDKIDLDGGATITVPQVLESVHTAGVRNGTRTINEKDGWTAIDGIRSEVTKYTESIDDGVALDNILEKIPATLLDDATVSETTYYRLTADGEEKAFVQDSGQSSSAGKAGHRHLLKKGYEAFTQLGYSVTIPTQEGEMPDGIGTPPIQPMKQSETFDEAQKLKAKLERKYERLYELFGDSNVALEAESTTITKPKQTIKNLSKAMRNDQKCAFLVKDGSESKGTFEYWARAGHRILSDPPFVSYKDGDGNRRFYNHTVDNPVKLKDGSYALRKTSDKDTVWRDDGDRIVLEDPDNKVKHTGSGVVYTYTYSQDGAIILRDPDGNEYNTRFPSWTALKASGDFEETNIPLAIFKTPSELDEPSASKFPYNYSYDQSAKEYVVRDSRGNTIETYDDKDAMLDGFDVIPKPVIPENLFPAGDYPEEDDWIFIIIPDAGKDIGPQIYRGTDDSGNSIIEPLFDEDDPYDAIKHDTTGDDDDDDGANPDDSDDAAGDGAEDGAEDDGEDWTGPRDDNEDDGKPTRPEPISLGGSSDSNDEASPNADAASETDDDEEVPIASDGKPKSTNDVVKNSGSVWTKPEEGDDDYDPTKDGKNFAHSHQHGNAGSWDGGDARDEDDGSMGDYQTPEEKQDERLREEYAKEKGIGAGNDAPQQEDNAEPSNNTEETPDDEPVEVEADDELEEVEATEDDDGDANDEANETNEDSSEPGGTDPFSSKGLDQKRLQRKRKKRKRAASNDHEENDDEPDETDEE